MRYFGSPDDMKLQLRSYAPLFALAAGDADNPFQRVLDKRHDEQTLALIVGPIPDLGRRRARPHIWQW
jgi:hypothetical protein